MIFRKNLDLIFLGPRLPEIMPKMRYFCYYSKWLHKAFLILAWSYISIKAENWVKHILTELLFWGFGGKKSPMGPKKRFFAYYGEWKHFILLIFWMKGWSYVSMKWLFTIVCFCFVFCLEKKILFLGFRLNHFK